MTMNLSKRSALVGAAVGMTALAGSIVGIATVAGAQDDSEPPIVDAPPATVFDETGIDEDFFSEEFLPEDIQAEIETWRPYEECVDTQIGDLEDPWVQGEELSDAEWVAFDAAWMAADEACRDLLPAEVQADMAVWDAFDVCLDEAGVFDDFEGDTHGGAVIFLETPDGFQTVEFGDIEGSVTITGTADGVTVTSTGGVTVIDEAALDAEWAAIDAAYESCEQLLPEDAFGELDFDFDFDSEG